MGIFGKKESTSGTEIKAIVDEANDIGWAKLKETEERLAGRYQQEYMGTFKDALSGPPSPLPAAQSNSGYARKSLTIPPAGGGKTVTQGAVGFAINLLAGRGHVTDPTYVPRVQYNPTRFGFDVQVMTAPGSPPGHPGGWMTVAVDQRAALDYSIRSPPLGRAPQSEIDHLKMDMQIMRDQVEALAARHREHISKLTEELKDLKSRVPLQKPAAMARGIDPWRNEKPDYTTWYSEDEDGLEVGYNGFPKPPVRF